MKLDHIKAASLITFLLPACSHCAYYYDGGATVRPYYKACRDSDGKVRVKCDSAHRLPNDDCK